MVKLPVIATQNWVDSTFGIHVAYAPREFHTHGFRPERSITAASYFPSNGSQAEAICTALLSALSCPFNSVSYTSYMFLFRKILNTYNISSNIGYFVLVVHM